MTTDIAPVQSSTGAVGPLAALRRTEVLGCPIHPISREVLQDELVRRIRERRPTTILFANVHKLVLARQDADLRSALAAADLVLPDGQPLVWAARWLGTPVPERLAGADMMHVTLELASQNSWRVFFLGTRPQVLRRAVRRVASRYPGLIMAGSHHGYFRAEESERVVAAINASLADVLLVALGSPHKELWLTRFRSQLNVPIRQAVGGSFDILAGKRRRAPRWMQRAGLEWLYRMLQDPVHLSGRYFFTNSIFLLLLVRALLRRAFGRSGPA